MARKKKTLQGPARRYRRSPKRYEDVRHMPSAGMLAHVTKLGCRDAARGQKNPYKPDARGLISAYREGYKICETIIAGRGRRLPDEQRRVARKLELETEIEFASRRRR